MIKARNEVIDLIMRHCEAAGLVLAPASSQIIVDDGSSGVENDETIDTRLRTMITETPIFAELSEMERENLIQAGEFKVYQQGDAIVQEGQEFSSIMIMCAGVVAMSRNDEEQWRLSPGDFFSHTGLGDKARTEFGLNALTPATVFEVNKDDLSKLFKEKPSLAREIATKLSRQVDLNRHSTGMEIHGDRNPHSVLKAIRTIFTH